MQGKQLRRKAVYGQEDQRAEHIVKQLITGKKTPAEEAVQKSSAAGGFSVCIHRKGAAGKLKAKEKSQENKTGDIPRGGRLADYV